MFLGGFVEVKEMTVKNGNGYRVKSVCDDDDGRLDEEKGRTKANVE